MKTLSEALDRHIASEVEVGTVRRATFTPETRSVDEKNRTITFVASDETVDRYGDIVRVKGWDLTNYRKNPVFLFGHRSQDPPIGKTVDIRTETSPKPALLQKVEFADAKTYPFADVIFNLYKNGFMRAVSVGFRPTEQPVAIVDESGMRTGGYEFVGQELLELSAVPIPANPSAVARMISAGVAEDVLAKAFLTPGQSAVADVTRTLDRIEAFLTRLENKKRASEAELTAAILQANAILDQEPYKTIITEGLLGKTREEITTTAALEKALRGAN